MNTILSRTDVGRRVREYGVRTTVRWAAEDLARVLHLWPILCRLECGVRPGVVTSCERKKCAGRR